MLESEKQDELTLAFFDEMWAIEKSLEDSLLGDIGRIRFSQLAHYLGPRGGGHLREIDLIGITRLYGYYMLIKQLPVAATLFKRIHESELINLPPPIAPLSIQTYEPNDPTLSTIRDLLWAYCRTYSFIHGYSKEYVPPMWIEAFKEGVNMDY